MELRVVLLCLLAWFPVGTALAQEQISVDVTITVPPVETTVVTPGTPTNWAGSASTALAGVQSTFGAEVCGGLGDPLQVGINQFIALTQARARATIASEQARLDRELVEQGLKLPDLVREDILQRGLTQGQSPECDELLSSLTTVMEQVSDYLGALRDAKATVLW